MCLQIRVKNHGQIADEEASEPGAPDFAAIEEHEAILAGWLQPAKLFREMLVKINAEFTRNLILDHDGMAEQAADDGAAQTIFIRKLIPAHGCEAAFGDGFLPGRNIAVILCIGVLNAADGGDAHAVEVGARFGGVALKITVQRAVLLGNPALLSCFPDLAPAHLDISAL